MNELAQGLWAVLATSFSLYFKTHAFHWNVEGPNFPQLHALFGSQYEELYGSLDATAELIRQLDAYAPMNPEVLLRASPVKGETGKPSAAEMVHRLVADHDIMIGVLNAAFQMAEAAGDQAAQDYLAGRLEAHKKHRWMLVATSKVA